MATRESLAVRRYPIAALNAIYLTIRFLIDRRYRARNSPSIVLIKKVNCVIPYILFLSLRGCFTHCSPRCTYRINSMSLNPTLR
jgi:hypothetical protein